MQVDPFAPLAELFTEHNHKAKRPRLIEESGPSSGLNMSTSWIHVQIRQEDGVADMCKTESKIFVNDI